MKKVGIVADNYKIDRFKNKLTAGGLTDFEVKPLTETTTGIFVNVADDKVNEVKKICQLVELHFHRSN